MRGFTKLKKIDELLFRIYPDHRQFCRADALTLVRLIQKVKVKHPLVVEVGSWTGFSTALLANEIQGKGKVFTVDHWEGNPGTPTGRDASLRDVYGVFKSNLIRIGVWDTVYPLVMDSETASTIFKDGMLDFVFIDADHRYESIKQDIKLWLPKLKKGGILAGHDAEFYYSKLSEKHRKLTDDSIGEDYFGLEGDDMKFGIHPGVVKALYEAFNDKHILLERRVWSWVKQ